MLVSDAQAQSATDTLEVENPELRRELREMKQRDQQARQALIEKQKSGAQLTLQDVAALKSVDTVNTRRMKSIVEEHGWPSEQLVGKDGADAAFLLVQHADHDPAFQKASLELLREAYEKGEATGRQVALLTDRVLVAEGKPQLYGTQAQIQNGEAVFRPIRDSVHVDQRRAEIGMVPIEEYKQKLREVYLQQTSGDQEEQ
jgi:hypothetical protein